MARRQAAMITRCPAIRQSLVCISLPLILDRTLRNRLIDATGHTPGVMNVPPATINVAGSREFPFTRDLRRR